MANISIGCMHCNMGKWLCHLKEVKKKDSAFKQMSGQSIVTICIECVRFVFNATAEVVCVCVCVISECVRFQSQIVAVKFDFKPC